MKLRFIILLTVIIVSLSAQISDPIEINEFSNDKKSSGQRAYQIVDGVVYITYQQYYIYFSKIINQNNQTHTIIDTLNNWYDRFADPAIQVLENGNIIIVYSEIENADLGYLKIATSTDDGESFSIESFEITNFGDPHIAQSDDGLDICYSNSLQEKSMAEFQHFTEYEESENADGGFASGIMKFWGPDELYGPVHSNDDIWLQQGGGGNNNGWPIFYEMVTTAGRFRNYNQGGIFFDPVTLDDICVGGWEEEVVPYIHNGSNDIRMNGIALGNDATDIIFVELQDGGFDCMYGEFVNYRVEEYDVYSWFPHNAEEANAVVNNGGNWYEDADLIYTNEITVWDTLWMPGESYSTNNRSFWIDHGELWIQGQVTGSTTFGCADTIFVIGDITYADTPVGCHPDGFSGIDLVTGEPLYEDPINTNDYFGLVSEQKILVRYKHRDPITNAVINNNSDGVAVHLYGAYAALGVGDTLVYGDMACHHDGIFTFQYQHPHGSTPNFTALSPYTLQETLYTFVDLHKYVFPQSGMLPPELEGFNLHGGQPVVNQTCGFPYESPAYINSYPNNNPGDYVYPYGTDYPWYNPVWPESSDDIVFERGEIRIFGSLAQTRRGYIHRSGSDDYNHPGDNEWDMDEYHYDGDHGSTGYDKNYYGDARFVSIQAPDFPKVIQDQEVPRNIYVLHSSNNGQNFSESYVEEVGEMLQALWMDSDGESVLIAYQTVVDYDSFHFLISDDDPQDFEHYVVESEGNKLKNAHILEDSIYVLCENYDQDIIYRYQIGNPIPELIQSFEAEHNLSDFTVSESGVLAYVHEINYIPNSMNLDFRYNNESGAMAGIVNWNYPFDNISFYDSEISIKLDENNTVYSTILLDHNTNNYSRGELYLISGELDGIVEIQEDEIIPPRISMQIYPNPFNPETTISFSLTTESTDDTEINIYNVKGQKVKQLISDQLSAGQHKAIWNGKDMNGKSVSTGIYLFELKSSGEVQKTKKGLLLK